MTTRPGPPSPAPPSPGSCRGRPSGRSQEVRRSQEVTSLPSSTEGQLYRALVVWAEHWIQEGRYTSLQEAIAEFIPRLEEVSSLSSDRQLCRIEFEHMGVREFLSYVVPSNTLDSEQFRARCIDVMQVGAAPAPCPLAITIV